MSWELAEDARLELAACSGRFNGSRSPGPWPGEDWGAPLQFGTSGLAAVTWGGGNGSHPDSREATRLERGDDVFRVMFI